MAALTLEVAGGVFKRVVAYVKEGQASGKPIGQLQSIRHCLATCSIDTARGQIFNFICANQTLIPPCRYQLKMPNRA